MILMNHYFQLKKTDEEYPVSNFSYSIVIITVFQRGTYSCDKLSDQIIRACYVGNVKPGVLELMLKNYKNSTCTHLIYHSRKFTCE